VYDVYNKSNKLSRW